jgi:hypothetical protein
MTTEYEQFICKGVPYYRNGTSVFTFSRESPIGIGTYDGESDNITFYSDWRDRVSEALAEYRSKLNATERDKLRDNLIKPAKKSRRSTKNTTRPRKTKSTTSK